MKQVSGNELSLSCSLYLSLPRVAECARAEGGEEEQALPLFPPAPSQGSKTPYTSQNMLSKTPALLSSAKRSSQDQVPIPSPIT